MVNNDNNGKIGCNVGRTKIIDPNDFNGFNSSSNMSVPTEDLNISVILRTSRKGRTVLSTDKDKNMVASSSKDVSVNFIQGSDINGKKVLTTKYTDLTTIVEYGTVNVETLGITNIDIDFNTSYTPQITINFVDLRGSSIFQNEDGITDFDNPYSTFFQIPYPTFELEIKGYYGKPVTYCLHMLKMNSKFNSKTGNFEIQCEFIGYTYAMLSDLLIGFLRANALTDIGIEKYKLYNANKDSSIAQPVLTLQELTLKLQTLNKPIEKEAATSPNSVGYENTKKALDLISEVQRAINGLGSVLEGTIKLKEESIRDTYPYIGFSTDNDIIQASAEKSYKDSIKKVNDNWETLNLDTKFNIADFSNINTIGENRGFYSNITKGMFNPNDTSKDSILKSQFGNPSDIKTFKEKIYGYLNDNYTLEEKTIINLYNMNYFYNALLNLKNKVIDENIRFKKELAGELKDTVRKNLEFSPTVRNVIEIYTAACEVFLESIYDVSVKAEAETNKKRETQLATKFLHEKNSDLKFVKTDPKANLKPKYYPWPDYKEDNGKGLFVEKYLGAAGVLTRPRDVEEIDFVEKLYEAFIKAAQAEADAENIINKNEKHWSPINPLDTKLLELNEPYGRLEDNSYKGIMRLAVIRGMTFLGYTNKESSLKDTEIIAMAEAEADNILRSAQPKVKQTLIDKVKSVNTDSTGSKGSSESTVTLNEYINITGKINNKDTRVIYENTQGKYLYNYIFEIRQPVEGQPTTKIKTNSNITPEKDVFGVSTDSIGDFVNKASKTKINYKSVLPINENFEGTWPNSNKELFNLSSSGNKFLTNYSSNYSSKDNNKKYIRIEDGGVYIKMIDVNEYNNIVNDFPLNELPNSYNAVSVLSLSGIQNKTVSETSGFNVLGGPLGVQEFNLIKDDVDNNGLEIPVSTIFYATSFNEQPNGLGLDRKNSDVPLVRVYDRKATNRENGTILQYLKSNGKQLHKSLGRTRGMLVKNKESNYKGITFPYFDQTLYAPSVRKTSGAIREQFNDNTFSLFGSKFYYAQKDQYAKAFLFLNNLPFNVDSESASPFSKNEIKHLFDTRGGLIHVPKLWCAWIGSILWRLDSVNEPVIENGIQIDGGSGPIDPIRWFGNGVNLDGIGENIHPNRFQYATCVNFVNKDRKPEFKSIYTSDLLLNLPVQVVREFKRSFFDFVKTEGGTSSWDDIRTNLEIWNGDVSDFNKIVDELYKTINRGNNVTTIENSLINIDKYKMLAPVKDSDFKHYLFLELDGDYSSNVGISTLINKMTEEVIILNTGYEIWQGVVDSEGDLKKGEENSIISVSKSKFNLYFNSLNKRLADSKEGLGDTDKNIQITSEIFGTNNQDIIKLRIYKHCKNIYDKWIGGVTDPNKIMFQCGVNAKNNGVRSNTDKQLALRYGNKTSKFIDSFRFVGRSFEDIGDKLYINPLPINDYLTENQNACIYDSISSLLASNNFDFIALPTFINFHDDEELKAVFKPYPNYTEAIKNGTCGPTFVCTYVGETSKHLAIANSEYTNDGFDLRCEGSTKTLNATKVPNDFITDTEKYEDPVAVFTVKYSQQNQNIFKDIILDQSEFTETEESLKIMDDISQKGAETNRTIAGQNLYSVHSVRSYKAEVEMMGNAMIQPMMYFQLDNIPMFHGAYMVIRTKHSIKPNHMSTNFTGVRIKYSKTPEIDAVDVYMSLIDTLDTASSVSTGAGGSSGSAGHASRTAKKTITCNSITKSVIGFDEVLKLVVKYLEGAYCRGGNACGSSNSGETLWGLDRKNHKGSLDNQFWGLVDNNSKSGWNNSSTPNVNSTSSDIQQLFSIYSKIIKKDYDSFSKAFYKSQVVKQLVESDGRLFFNMVYAVYNGGAYFKGLCKIMQNAYDSGTKTSDGLLKVVVDERVSGLKEAYRLGSKSERARLSGGAATLLANTGVDIEKLVGLSNQC